MKNLLSIVSFALLCSCAPNYITQPEVPVEKPAVAKNNTKRITKDNWSIDLPVDLVSVSNTNDPIDTTYMAPDKQMVVAFAVDDDPNDTLSKYASGFAKGMVEAGGVILDSRAGKISGLDAALIIVGVDSQDISFNFITLDTKKAYVLSCSLVMSQLKERGKLCFDIAHSVVIR